ncbi:MAG: hypothetical protein IKU86_12750 [Thermoguttaceae bacterium]|nr:hypothetical protein [Thermoguttaceae bacterium]
MQKRLFRLTTAFYVAALTAATAFVSDVCASSDEKTPGDVASTECAVTIESQYVVDQATKRGQRLPAPPDAQAPFRVTAEIFPNVIRFGDPVYIAVYLENISSSPRSYLSNLVRPVNDPLIFSVASSEIPGEEARCYFERQTRAEATFHRPPLETLAPGERRLWWRCVVELPPLEDLDEPFYRALQEKIAQAPVSCDLNLKTGVGALAKPVYGGDSLFCRVEGRLPVVVESRPENEMATLRRWLDKTKENNLLPRVDGFDKVAWQDDASPDLPATPTSFLRFGSRSFSPWTFIRPGNRKPSTPNNPTTLDGWKSLETEFAPSTLRDEITLTRLQLEYYDAPKGEASDAALQTLVDWLSQRPTPQRVVLTDFLLSEPWKFRKSSLKEKNANLCDALTSDPKTKTPQNNDVK